ncbi:MAG: hypothetical protein AAB588_04635 [Patescibacteria group bacterium]
MRILEIGGALLFMAVVFFTILFAEGYQYDSRHNDLVKKGVIYFESAWAQSPEPKVTLDGQPIKMAFPGEIRTAPGAHQLEISAPGYFPWKKNIIVPGDEVLRFPAIRLFPMNATLSSESSESLWFHETAFEKYKDLALQSFSDDGVFLASFKLHFAKWYSLESPESFWITEWPFEKNQLKKVAPFSKKSFVVLNQDKRISAYLSGIASGLQPLQAPPILDIHEASGKIFALSGDGTIWSVPEDGAPQAFAALGQPMRSFTSLQHAGDHWVFLLQSQADPWLLVTNEDGSVIFQQKGIASAYLEGETLTYVQDKTLAEYDLQEKKLKSSRTLDASISWFSPIGKTYHSFFLNTNKELQYCDKDFENCHLFAKLDLPWIVASKDRTAFFTLRKGKFILFELEESAGLPKFLQNLVSLVFPSALRE